MTNDSMAVTRRAIPDGCRNHHRCSFGGQSTSVGPSRLMERRVGKEARGSNVTSDWGTYTIDPLLPVFPVL
jgi:hypothetical protein